MYARRETVTLTTAAGGAATGYTKPITGRIVSIRYVKGTFADGVDFDLTAETTGEQIWHQDNVNASVTVAPRQATHTTLGAAALYAAAGTPVNDRIVLAGDRIKIAITNGGDLTTGTFHVTVD